MITAIRRRLGRPASSEDGMSLTELLVTMFISGIVLAIVANMFINVARVTATSGATNNRNSIAANIVNEASEVIRLAANNPIATSEDADPAVVSGAPAALTLYSVVDTTAVGPRPSKVTFRLDSSNNVVEDRIVGKASGVYWVFTDPATTRIIGGPVTSTTAAPLFTYLDSSGAVVDADGSGLTTAERSTIASVKVSVRIENAGVAASNPIIVVNTVGMPNLKLGRMES